MFRGNALPPSSALQQGEKIIYIIQATGLSGSWEEKERVPDLGQYE